jgi:hypothetical protein
MRRSTVVQRKKMESQILSLPSRNSHRLVDSHPNLNTTLTEAHHSLYSFPEWENV